jgi:DNA (cytosine-5)-methyltransferase 1
VCVVGQSFPSLPHHIPKGIEVITGVSLFAGVGGFDLAMQRVGIDVVASVEIDRHAQRVLQRHFPMMSLHSDIEQVTGEQLRADGFDPSDGIVTGGFPCQDLSTAGARRGLAGNRSGLFWQIIRLADELEPKWLILENVPGLLSSNGGRDMGIVIRSLEKRGYGVCWRVLDAQHFGVAQRRRRLFFVCCLGDHRRPVEILFEPESGIRDSAPRRKTKQETPRSIKTGTYRKVKRAQSIDDYESWELDDKVNTLNSFDLGDTRTTQIFASSSFSSYHSGFGTLRANDDGHEKIVTGFSYYQSTPNISGQISPTIGQISQAVTFRPNVSNEFGGIVRRLTPKECERLQGFPDDWTSGQTDGQRYKQMGNAVAVPVVEWILRRLVK